MSRVTGHDRSRVPLVMLCVAAGLLGSAGATVFSVGHITAIGRTGKLRFANVLSDDVQGWEYQRGHYRVREPGYYYLAFHGLSRHNDPLTLAVFRNDEELIAGYGSGNDYSTASNSGLVYLSRNDRISLRIISGFAHESNDPRRNYFTLSGFRVGADGIGVRPPPVPAFTGGSSFSSPGPSLIFGGSDTQPGGIGVVSKRFSSSTSASSPPAAGAGTEEADEFRPLDTDADGPV